MAPAAAIVLLPGDVYCTRPTRGTSWPWRLLAWAIGEATQDPGEGETLATHTGGISRGGTLRDALAAEAVWPRWHVAPLLECCKGKEVTIWRLVALTDGQRASLGARYAARVGQPYNVLRLALFGIDNLISRIRGKRTRLAQRVLITGLAAPVCSTGIAVDVSAETGLAAPFDVRAVETKPDDVCDRWSKNQTWVQVAPTDGRLFATLDEMLAAKEAVAALRR